MSTKADELEQLKVARLRLKRILASDRANNSSHRAHIQKQLQLTETSIQEVETAIDNAEPDIPGRPFTRKEIDYLNSLLRARKAAADIYSDISIAGQLSKASRRLTEAAAEFIELHHEVYQAVSHAFEAGKSDVVTVDTFAELFKVVNEHQRIAIIGDPGAGKTTTMNKLAHHFGVLAQKSGHGPIPVFVDLSVRGHSLDQLIEHSAPLLDIPTYAPGELVLFFDALNEASSEVVNALVDWLAVTPERRAIVSCRKLDYFDRKLPLRRVDLLPLNVRQIYNLIGKFFGQPQDVERLFWALAGRDSKAAWQWYRTSSGQEFPSFENFWEGDIGHAYPYEIEKHKIAELQAAARQKSYPGVLDIVTNPFLLFIAINIFLCNEAPPESRGMLFEQFVSLMMTRSGWSESNYSSKEPTKSKVEAMRMIGQMAYQMIQDGQGTGVTESWIRSFVLEQGKETNVDQFIFSLKRSGIMEWRGGKLESVKFRHQLLQEYFASLCMRDLIEAGAPASQFWADDAWWEHTPWDEVAVLLSDVEVHPGRIVRWLAPTNPSLAYRCVSERGGACSDELLATVLNEKTSNRICPIAKAEWGRRLARKGDNRSGVGTQSDGTPDIAWIMVPPGSFQMGGGTSLLEELGLFVSERLVEMPYPYLIAKYPVTCAQFGVFLLEGYGRDEFWTKSGLDWRGSQNEPRLWDDPRFNIPNHPVVGVTWFEAVAYTRWLDAKVRGANWRHPALGERWEVSLPTEAEWEKAARYPDGRRFPWGDTYLPGAANIDETFQGDVCGPYALRRTTAVGLYEAGASALGIYDLCGNVWEWCLSKWDVQYRSPEDVRIDGNVHRGVRGGSWYNSVAFAVSAAHDCHDSDLGVNDVGFRPVIRPLRD